MGGGVVWRTSRFGIRNTSPPNLRVAYNSSNSGRGFLRFFEGGFRELVEFAL
jgi:hypothetical protein